MAQPARQPIKMTAPYNLAARGLLNTGADIARVTTVRRPLTIYRRGVALLRGREGGRVEHIVS